MRVEKHLSGKHFTIYEAPWWVLWVYFKTGQKLRLGSIKTKLVYKGVK